jgi:hypothetical protein
MNQHEKRITRSYLFELFTAIAVYMVLLFVSIRYGRPLADGPLRTAILVTPMLGFGLMIRAVARQLSRVDEYIRAMLLETIALAAALTAAISFTYGFLETAGFPRLSMFAVWMIMGSCWLLVCLLRRIRER